MIRKAVLQDLDKVENGYNELFIYEKEHGAYTVWEQEIYPTKETIIKSLSDNSLYVMDVGGDIPASIIFNQKQPVEYTNINWKNQINEEEVVVIHLLCVKPSKAGMGIGMKMVQFALDNAKKMNAKVVRLDTGSQNKPAVALYTKLGFKLVGTSTMAIGGMIEHEGHLFFEYELK